MDVFIEMQQLLRPVDSHSFALPNSHFLIIFWMYISNSAPEPQPATVAVL